MEVSRAIKERRSVRSYKQDPVPEEDLKEILDAGRWAPSAGNRQPLELVVIKEDEKRRELARAARGQSFITEAPVAIVVCANVPRTSRRYGERGRKLYVIQDTAAATQNMHLMAYALGYATCWVGSFDDGEVEKVTETPDHIRPLAIISLGKPAEEPATPPRRGLEEIVHETDFSEKD